MSEKHIGKVIQVIGPVLDIQFKDSELPELLDGVFILSDQDYIDIFISLHISFIFLIIVFKHERLCKISI